MNNRSRVVKARHFEFLLRRREGVYYADGRRNGQNLKRYSLGTRDKEEALGNIKRLDEKLAIDAGLVIDLKPEKADKSDISLRDGVEKYLAHVGRPRSAKGCSEATRKRYKLDLDRFLLYAQGNGIRCWRQVGPRQLDAFTAAMVRDGFANASQVQARVIVKQCINYLIREKLLAADCQFRLDIDRDTMSHRYCFKRPEVLAMIALAEQEEELEWLGDVIITLALTGLRISELIQLQWSNVLFDENVLQIQDTSRNQPVQIARTTKNRTTRLTPIPAEVRKRLERLAEKDTNGVVFRSRMGKALNAAYARKMFRSKIVTPLAPQFDNVESGEPTFSDGSLHSLRHYFVSVCANANIPREVLMAWVGHRDSNMINRYYTLHDDMSQQQMQRLSKQASLQDR